jgi:Arc/MetJ family transcription regulator
MEAAMRTTLDLNENLLEEAMRISGEKTKTSIIHKALTDYINKSNARGILAYGGKMDLNIDLDKLRGRVWNKNRF